MKKKKRKERTRPTKEDDGSGNPCSEYLTSKKVISRLSDCSCACNLCFPYRSGSLGGDRGIGSDDADGDERAFPSTVAAAAVAVAVVAAAAMAPSTQTTALPKKEENKKNREKKTAVDPTRRTPQKQRSRPSKRPNNNKITKSYHQKDGRRKWKDANFFWSRRG